MKLSLIAAIAASAVYVSAAPLRVVVVSTNVQQGGPDPFTHLRFGHAAAPPNVAQLKTPAQAPDAMHRRPCAGRMGRFRQQSIEMANKMRKMLGLPLIETDTAKIVPVVGTPTWISFGGPAPNGHGWRGKTKGGDSLEIFPAHAMHGGPNYPPYPHHHAHARPHRLGHEESFFYRMQVAIMSLGPWEGRAVAFVLGCGIGVLLRMLWVLGVVSYRAIRGAEGEYEYTPVSPSSGHNDDDEPVRRTPISAPPIYVYPVDEKIAIETTEEVQRVPNTNSN